MFALLSPEMTPALCCCSLCIYCNIWELLVLFNEAVLPVSPWEGKCYHSQFTGREMKHTGTWHRAEQDLKSPFNLWGLNLCLRYFPVLSAPLTPLCPFPQPAAQHQSLCSISFPSGCETLNHLNQLGLLRELNGRRHILSATIPDTPACQTLRLLEGT